MKRNVLNEIENIKKDRQISSEDKNKIKGRLIANAGISISIIILMMIFLVVSKSQGKTLSTFTYNIGAVQLLILALIVLEIAYKKDEGSFVIFGLEILCISIITLFSPYIFLKFSYFAINMIIGVITIYYIGKIIVIYNLESKRYLSKLSDIPDIVKKESEDELVKQFQYKRQQEMQKTEIKSTAAKRGRKPKTETEKKKTSTKTTKKKNTESMGVEKKNNTRRKQVENAEPKKGKTKKTTVNTATKPIRKSTSASKTSTKAKKNTVENEENI